MYFAAVVGGSSHLWRRSSPPAHRSRSRSARPRRRALRWRRTAGRSSHRSGPAGARSGFATPPASERSRRKATRWLPAFPAMAHACSISWCGLGGICIAAGSRRLPNCALWTSRPGRATVCCRAFPSPITISRATRRMRSSRQRNTSAYRRSGWRPSTRRTPPRQVARAGDQVSFGADGDLVFRSLEETAEFPGSDQERRHETRTLHGRVGPRQVRRFARRRPVIVTSPLELARMPDLPRSQCPPTAALPEKSVPDRLPGVWSSDGRFFYVEHDRNSSDASSGKTVAIPVPAGTSLPDLPASGISETSPGLELPGAQGDRAGISVARDRPFDVRFHQDGPAAQPLSDTAALTDGLSLAVTCEMRTLFVSVPVPGWKFPALPYRLFSLQMNARRSPTPVRGSGRNSRAVNVRFTDARRRPRLRASRYSGSTVIEPRVPLDHVELLGVRRAAVIEPPLVVEADGIDHERVAFPPADRVAGPRGNQILRVLPAIHVDDAVVPGVAELMQDVHVREPFRRVRRGKTSTGTDCCAMDPSEDRPCTVRPAGVACLSAPAPREAAETRLEGRRRARCPQPFRRRPMDP